MELWFAGTIQAVISGVVLFYLKHAVNKSANDTQRITELEKKVVQKEMADMIIRFTGMEQRHEKAMAIIDMLKEKVIVLIQKNEDLTHRILEMGQQLEQVKVQIQMRDHGRVIRK